MKQLRELKFEELTVKQKLGLVNTVVLSADYSDETEEYAVKKIRDHAVGAVWIQWSPFKKDAGYREKFGI